MNHIIDLKEKVTEAKLDTCLVISSVVYQTTTKKIAAGLHKAMKTKEGLLYGTAFQGSVNIAIEDVESDEIDKIGVIALVKKAELHLRNSDQKGAALKVSAKDL